MKKKVFAAFAGIAFTLGLGWTLANVSFNSTAQGYVAQLHSLASQPGLWIRPRLLTRAEALPAAPLGKRTQVSSVENPLDFLVSHYDLSAHHILSRVILLLRENYVDPDRFKPYDMFMAALDYIQKTIPEVMVDDSQAPEQMGVSVGQVRQNFETGGLDQLWEVSMALRDIFCFLQKHINDPIQRRDIEYAAVNGMLSTLDPHSVLLKPESFDEVKLSTKGEFGGVGIVVSIRDGALTAISPIEGTPAFQAGIKARDRIVRIGEESTVNMALDEAVQKLRGKPGSHVQVAVQGKPGTEPRLITLTRAVIKIHSVTSALLESGIGYIKLKSFQGNTFDDLQAHLERLDEKNQGQKLKGLILDMRNNPGGLLDQAILVSDRFVERGPLVITVSEGRRKREVKSAHAAGTELGYPMAVLINGGSASASEIVAGALQNHNRAVVIGQQSFGKGSVQVLYDFKDRSALKLTIAQYLTPGDVSIQSVGITPDVSIVPVVVDPEALHVIDDDALREKDLQKHLDQFQRPGIQSGHLLADTHSAPVLLRHWVPKEDPENPVAAAFENETPESLASDFEIQLAQQMLSTTRHLARADILKDAVPLMQAKQQEQQRIIAQRFEALGVDWSTGVYQGPSPLAVSLTARESQQSLDQRLDQRPQRAAQRPQGAAQPYPIQKTSAPKDLTHVQISKQEQTVRAGQRLTFTAQVQNKGQRPLYQVYGVTDSDNPLLKNLEFAFGKLMPGQSRSFDVTIKLPADMNARADRVRLLLSDLHGATQRSAEPSKAWASALITIEEQKKPRFAYSYRIESHAVGQEDGVLHVGQKVTLNVDVSNLGPAPAHDATVFLKNLSGQAVFLKKGRAHLGEMAAHATQTGRLRFEVRTDVPEVQLKLSIWDSMSGTSISETVSLPVKPKPQVVWRAQALKVRARSDVPVFIGASDQMACLGHAKPGAVLQSDARLGSWWRVQLASGIRGFVRKDDVIQARRRSTAYGVRLQEAQTAPQVALQLPSHVVARPQLVIEGLVSDAQKLKDVFVFLNEKKIYYQALQDTVPSVPTRKGVQIRLNVPAMLKPGSNTVAVIARKDKDMLTRHIFGVFYDEPHALADNNTPEVSVPDRRGYSSRPNHPSWPSRVRTPAQPPSFSSEATPEATP